MYNWYNGIINYYNAVNMLLIHLQLICEYSYIGYESIILKVTMIFIRGNILSILPFHKFYVNKIITVTVHVKFIKVYLVAYQLRLSETETNLLRRQL